MKKAIYYFSLIAAFGLLYSCSKQNEEKLSQQTTTPACDTLLVTYSATVQPIISLNCYSCHGSTLAQAGIRLNTYALLKNLVSNNSLVNVINHAPGYSAMPYGLPKMAQCDINKIVAWVNRGALNN